MIDETFFKLWIRSVERTFFKNIHYLFGIVQNSLHSSDVNVVSLKVVIFNVLESKLSRYSLLQLWMALNEDRKCSVLAVVVRFIDLRFEMSYNFAFFSNQTLKIIFHDSDNSIVDNFVDIILEIFIKPFNVDNALSVGIFYCRNIGIKQWRRWELKILERFVFVADQIFSL